jgi:RNA-directed DNA polymerase
MGPRLRTRTRPVRSTAAEVTFCVRGVSSPLLSNILLDDLDRELERRGHRFARYADDCNVYVQSRAAGERVLTSLERFLTKRLRLRVNREKSAVARPWQRKFLGYTVTRHRQPKLRVAPQPIERLKTRVRWRLRVGRGQALPRTVADLTPRLRGWVAYFRMAEVKSSFEALDAWLRRRCRCILWRQWKRPRTRAKELTRRGLDPTRARVSAYNGHGPWWNAGARHMHAAVPTAVLRGWGLLSLLDEQRRLQGAL